MKSEIARAREAVFAPSAGRHYLNAMTDKPKRPRDANQLAKFIVDMATEGESPVPLPDHDAQREGGLKGGKARADKLSSEDRREIAKKAARAR